MQDWIQQTFNIDIETLSFWVRIAVVVGIFLVSFLVDLIFSKLIAPIIKRITLRTKAKWDDILLCDEVVNAFSRMLPAIILTAALPFVFENGLLGVLVARATIIYIIITACNFLISLVQAVFGLFVHHKEDKALSLAGIRQTFEIIIWIIGIINIIAVVIDRDPLRLLAGLGAAATVMMFVLQDTIKGLVAGIQLTFQDMLRVGDWISMPSRDTDGVVTDITLNTVKIRNWDNTITTLPPYALLSESFRNWRGMKESDGRRFNRCLYINVHSIKLLTPAQLQAYVKQWDLPASFLERPDSVTNLEVYRFVMERHMRQDPEINPEMTHMVRHLPTGNEGVPLELYAFARDKEWISFEHLQARMLEFAYAMLPKFGLRSYQRSSDLKLSPDE